MVFEGKLARQLVPWKEFVFYVHSNSEDALTGSSGLWIIKTNASKDVAGILYPNCFPRSF